VKIEFDRAKSEKNARERDLPFEAVAEFDWETALYAEDSRFPYPERRFVALGFIDARWWSPSNQFPQSQCPRGSSL